MDVKLEKITVVGLYLLAVVYAVVCAAPDGAAGVAESVVAESAVGCKQLTGMWGDVNPNIFYICDVQSKTALEMRCPEGRGFFNGLGYSGCIPYDQWPACIAAGSLMQICDSEHMAEPWETVNPNKFYMCLTEERDPIEVSCEAGKGFVNVAVGGDGGASTKIVGCARWDKWRGYMQCGDYY